MRAQVLVCVTCTQCAQCSLVYVTCAYTHVHDAVTCETARTHAHVTRVHTHVHSAAHLCTTCAYTHMCTCVCTPVFVLGLAPWPQTDAVTAMGVGNEVSPQGMCLTVLSTSSR